MFSHRSQHAQSERDADWKLAYLRRTAPLNAVVSLFALAASMLLHVPDIRFLIATATLGVCTYFAWSMPKLKTHLVWLVPLAVVPTVIVAGNFSEGTSKSVGSIQFGATVFASLSVCFLLEALWRRKRTPKRSHEA
jgi:hypothetical protein